MSEWSIEQFRERQRQAAKPTFQPVGPPSPPPRATPPPPAPAPDVGQKVRDVVNYGWMLDKQAQEAKLAGDNVRAGVLYAGGLGYRYVTGQIVGPALLIPTLAQIATGKITAGDIAAGAAADPIVTLANIGTAGISIGYTAKGILNSKNLAKLEAKTFGSEAATTYPGTQQIAYSAVQMEPLEDLAAIPKEIPFDNTLPVYTYKSSPNYLTSGIIEPAAVSTTSVAALLAQSRKTIDSIQTKVPQLEYQDSIQRQIQNQEQDVVVVPKLDIPAEVVPEVPTPERPIPPVFNPKRSVDRRDRVLTTTFERPTAFKVTFELEKRSEVRTVKVKSFESALHAAYSTVGGVAKRITIRKVS